VHDATDQDAIAADLIQDAVQKTVGKLHRRLILASTSAAEKAWNLPWS
jgi:hypothetical protein